LKVLTGTSVMESERTSHRLQRSRTATRPSYSRAETARSHHPPSRVKIGMFATSLPTIIGLIAGGLSSWSLVPQILKCWRDGLTEAVSKKMFATRAVGLVLWCIYGYFAGSVPVVIFSSLNLVLSITILVLTIRNSSAEEGA
jgi:MtN3 and saliva related transmembrane protein